MGNGMDKLTATTIVVITAILAGMIIALVSIYKLTGTGTDVAAAKEVAILAITAIFSVTSGGSVGYMIGTRRQPPPEDNQQ
jgi:ABC-type transporter Mla maintaining outer membrane lipid asymmetry permease subunit MlaE